MSSKHYPDNFVLEESDQEIREGDEVPVLGRRNNKRSPQGDIEVQGDAEHSLSSSVKPIKIK